MKVEVKNSAGETLGFIDEGKEPCVTFYNTENRESIIEHYQERFSNALLKSILCL